MRECVRDVFAIYDNNISPGLLMIIIKIIILYFIQIRHIDDFPPTGTPASTIIIILHSNKKSKYIHSYTNIIKSLLIKMGFQVPPETFIVFLCA